MIIVTGISSIIKDMSRLLFTKISIKFQGCRRITAPRVIPRLWRQRDLRGDAPPVPSLGIEMQPAP